MVYARAPEAAPGVAARAAGRRPARAARDLPTVARFLLAGRPLPRIEDAVRVGELMRRAALARVGWQTDETGNRRPLAPWEISGRGADGKPLKDPSHRHAFWLPEDADGDGWIDHVSVFVAGGMNREVQARLDRITRLWLAPKQRSEAVDAEPGAVKEWRLALEGFGRPADFAGGARISTLSRWPHRAFRIVPPPRSRRLGSASSPAMRWSAARWAFHVSAAAFDSFIPAPRLRRPSGRRRAAFPNRRSTD